MRILHLTTHLNIGGITTYIERLIQPLKELGVDTYVFSSGGERVEAFRQKGVTVFEVPIKTKNEAHPKLWFALPELIKMIRANKIDVLHAHTRVTQVLASAARLLTGVPVVTTCHGFFKMKLGRKIFPCWGDCVIAISSMVRDQLINDFHVPPGKIRLISNAVNLQELEIAYALKNPAVIKGSYGFSAEDPVVGITARLVDDKGHEFLIKAIPLLKIRFPNIRLLIAGEGRYRGALEDLTHQLNVGSHVHFCGNVADITEPLAAMDVFALPATWREGFGLSVIEAMACRKPVIVSNIWALNTLVQDRQNGLVVEPKQIEPLAQAIASLLEDKPLAQALTQNAYSQVKENYAISRMAQEIHSLYREFLPIKS